MLVESIYRTCITNRVARSDGYIVIIIVVIDIHGLGRGGCVFVVFVLSVGDSMHSVGGSFGGGARTHSLPWYTMGSSMSHTTFGSCG